MTPVEMTDLDLRVLFREMGVEAPARDVVDITTESGNAVRGGLFLACAGTRRHGLEFVDQAVAAGIEAVAFEPGTGIRPPSLPAGVAVLEVPGLRHRLGDLANRFFASPSTELSVTGITGTNGKTTTAWLVVQALGRLGRPAGYMGTLGFGLGTTLARSDLTTPGCITVHRRLRELADAGAQEIIAEVSSHALDQGRVDGVRFRTAAFTNLTRDHLDYHGDLDQYGAAKSRLFAAGLLAPDTAVINVADPFGRSLADRLAPGTRLIAVALATDEGPAPRSDLEGRLRKLTAAGLELELAGESRTALLRSPLWGRFNAENLLVAAGILLADGFSLDRVALALGECVAPPGRMEMAGRPRADRPMVLVDFAHTPDALRKALAAVREHCAGRVWCVFGCGGDRDIGKRAPMGAAAAELADRVILTDDNPRNEDPRRIIADILAGMPDRDRVEVVVERAAAIELAIRSAAPGDAVLIAGKGHEQVQITGGQSRAFSDLAVARTVLGGKA